MPTYAAETTVPVERSRAEIERTLVRFGATGFLYGWDDDNALIGFVMNGRQIKFLLPMPDRKDRSITHSSHRWPRPRTPKQIEDAYQKAVRQRWRALALVIKAKLEAVESGIAEFEDEFLAYIALPDGRTFGQWARPQIDDVYQSGNMPALMPGGT
jgi:hypothetical protein